MTGNSFLQSSTMGGNDRGSNNLINRETKTIIKNHNLSAANLGSSIDSPNLHFKALSHFSLLFGV